MVRQIFYRVLLCVAWSVGVLLVHEYVYPVAIAETGHVLVGVVVGLLLVFRTNSSYDRFWEGRKQWGNILNESRNLLRASSVLLASTPNLLRQLLGWAIAFPYATMNLLRGQQRLGVVPAWLPAEQVEAAAKADHVALAVARRMSDQLAEARQRGAISDYVQMELDRNVQLLVDYLGACERIRRTPLPFAYMVHLRRLLILYCFTLPFALLHIFGWLTPIVTLLIAYTMYGIEEIGVEIEDPFGRDDNDLPLEHFCATIERNLLALVPTDLREAYSGPRTGELSAAESVGSA
jgi:putative membrane protein